MDCNAGTPLASNTPKLCDHWEICESMIHLPTTGIPNVILCTMIKYYTSILLYRHLKLLNPYIGNDFIGYERTLLTLVINNLT